ncbi:MAG: DUF3073 domain-containing protein [Corynebacterium sp.]|uniref:DUF3073 domain-containing protein n=1 Tax=Corynebacterium sp. TaxID=1720 RepID=UPI0026DB9BA8|nr:DUF3073 domain-containing protein [Corynebacterium sp.]MDO5099017.1 DUF3073 domain-containing protein [Corynebacterium sp.]
MGRGRAKAKQTKVARQLKYNTPNMDLDSLQRELAGQSPSRNNDRHDDYDDDYDDYADAYSEYADWVEDEEDEKK